MTLAAEFKALHAAPGFIMPNAWDVGSALILAAAGFKAIATTSAGIAFSLGQQDYADDPRFLVSREEMFARIREIVEAVDIPVSADLEAGYGDSPEAVAETVRMAIEAGLAGCNIEDRIPCEARLYDESLACERIAAARAAIDAAGSDFVLTARSDVLFLTADDLTTTIHRANLYRAAGADCLFTPGVTDLPSISRLAADINGPLNMVLGLNTANGSKWEAW